MFQDFSILNSGTILRSPTIFVYFLALLISVWFHNSWTSNKYFEEQDKISRATEDESLEFDRWTWNADPPPADGSARFHLEMVQSADGFLPQKSPAILEFNMEITKLYKISDTSQVLSKHPGKDGKDHFQVSLLGDSKIQ